MIEVTHISKSYRMGEHTVHALRDVSLKIEQGDFVAIMGPSGSGKSTLAHVLGLLDVPTTGGYKLNEREVSKLSEDELAVLRREEIGFIFQQFNLLPRVTAFENVALPNLYSKRPDGPHQARGLLERVGLTSHLNHKSNELSGGQQQRVAIARALLNHPRIILADEPTGNLDSVSEKEIMAILRELNQQGITVVMVTHEDQIGEQAKRIIRMRDGAIQSDQRLAPIGERARAIKPEAQALPTSSLHEIFEHFRLGFKTLAANKVRTTLSMLGILIGVAAVVAMLALGRGAQRSIEAQLSSLGSNLLVLRSGAIRVAGVAQTSGETARLTFEDAIHIQNHVPTIKYVAPGINGRAQVTYANKNWSTQIQGTTPEYAKMRSSEAEIGRFFNEDENKKRARVAVIGATVVRELFGQQNPIGEMIKINKIPFQVIGVLPVKGATGWRDQDDVVIMPTLTAMHRVLGRDYVENIDIEVIDATRMEETQEAVLNLMYARKRMALSNQKDAFQIRNMAEIQAAMNQSSKTMGALLASIAAISLLVGGIGIMNIMLVSVTERTKEIGLRKAIGARRRDILLQFLAESIVVSVVGGLAGIVLGWMISTVLSGITGWTTSVSIQSILLSFFFSAFIGILFGIYPARKASRLHPIVALRYE